MPTLTLPQAFALALEHQQAGRLGDAEALYRQILAAHPGNAEALQRLGLLSAAYFQVGNALLERRRLDEAIAAYQRVLRLRPTQPEVHLHLGIALAGLSRFEEAAASFRRALALKPDDAEAHNNLGNVLKNQGHVDEAIEAYHRALQFKPDFVTAIYNLGTALKERGDLEEAIVTIHRVLELQPDHAEACNNLGNALQNLGRLDEAVAAYHRARQLQPGHSEIHNNLGNALMDQGHLDEAIAAFRRALELRPNDPEVCNNLANALKDRGQLDEAVAGYRRSVELRPTHARTHSNLIFALHNHPDGNDRLITAEHGRWNWQFSNPLKRNIRPYANDRDPNRRLKIGYVSPDFRMHPVSFFFLPLLEAHDHARHEIYCYAGVLRTDAVTERVQKAADVWRDARTWLDEQFVERVRADGIDILVDLTMHTAGNRLPVFARKPAPVQVSWLAYPGSTGLDTIDYRLTDAHIDPAQQSEAGAGGEAVRLPDAWCCYEPLGEFPAVAPLPAEQTKTVTFGSLNQFSKLHVELLRCWACLLKAVPGSRLLIVCPEGQASEQTRALFAGQGIAPGRIELVPRRPWPEYLRLFERIDVALDAYPCNGMTSTCHALWMGLPVVTRMGTSAVARAGSSLLNTIGFPEWIAHNEEDYIRIAAGLAGGLPRLAGLRANLRARLQASPLMDAPRFARHVEAAFRAMWRRWCAGQTSPSP